MLIPSFNLNRILPTNEDSSRGMTGKTRNPKSPLRPHLRECAAQSRPSDPIFVFAYSRQNTKNPPKSPLRPPQLVPWFSRFIRISALMSKTRVLKCAISMPIMVVIAGQCDHFQPWRETRGNPWLPISANFCNVNPDFHCRPWYAWMWWGNYVAPGGIFDSSPLSCCLR